MRWNKHSELEGKHAFLSPSQYHWINYDDEKLIFMFKNMLATERGTALHDLAAKCIKLNQDLPKKQKTLNMYVNDALGFKMQPEQPLKYSDNFFGTADAISFRKERSKTIPTLRIHDLKTGTVKAHMEQLMLYAALFCLEYKVNPKDIEIELRIYQNNDIQICNPPVEAIIELMATARRFDTLINKILEEES